MLNAAKMPLLRSGVACLAGGGTTAANVVAASTVDLVLSAGTPPVAVAAGYPGNVARVSPSPCASAGSNPTGQSTTAAVVLPANAGAVSLTMSVAVYAATTAAAARRDLQGGSDDNGGTHLTAAEIADLLASLGSGSTSALAVQLAAVMASLGASLGVPSDALLADPAGVTNTTDVAQQAATTGLPPPTPQLLAAVGPWLATLGPGMLLSQLSSVVLDVGGDVRGIDANVAVEVGDIVKPSPSPAAAAAAAAAGGGGSAAGIGAGIAVALLLAAAAVGLFVVLRRRRRSAAAEALAGAKASVRASSDDGRRFVESKMLAGGSAGESFRAPPPKPLAALGGAARPPLAGPGAGAGGSFRQPIAVPLATARVPAVRSAYVPAPGDDASAATAGDPSASVAARQLNAMSIFGRSPSSGALGRNSSVSTLLRSASAKRVAGGLAAGPQTSVAVEDARGRMAFTSAAARGAAEAVRKAKLSRGASSRSRSSRHADGGGDDGGDGKGLKRSKSHRSRSSRHVGSDDADDGSGEKTLKRSKSHRSSSSRHIDGADDDGAKKKSSSAAADGDAPPAADDDGASKKKSSSRKSSRSLAAADGDAPPAAAGDVPATTDDDGASKKKKSKRALVDVVAAADGEPAPPPAKLAKAKSSSKVAPASAAVASDVSDATPRKSKKKTDFEPSLA